MLQRIPELLLRPGNYLKPTGHIIIYPETYWLSRENVSIRQPSKPSSQRFNFIFGYRSEETSKENFICIEKFYHSTNAYMVRPSEWSYHGMDRFYFMLWADVNIYLNRLLNRFFNNQFKISRIQLNDKKNCFKKKEIIWNNIWF